MENNLSTFADRLKAKLAGSEQKVHADSGVTDLVDAHLDLVSAAHGSAHGSGHGSGHGSAGPIEQEQI
jgi:hypothetical protein